MKSVVDAFHETVAGWSQRPFLCLLPEVASVYSEPPQTWTYADASAEVTVLADRYRSARFGAGHRVGLMLGNRPAFFFHWLALNACGASVVPLSTELRAAELDYLIAHSGITLAVVAAPYRSAMSEAAARAPHRIGVIGCDEVPPLAGSAIGDGRECAVLYTSGTTGKPKGCVLNNDYFLRAGERYINAGGLCHIVPGLERLLTPLPMTHMNAMAYSTMAMLMSGGCIVPLDRFHPRGWWASVRRSEATIVHYLGVMPSMLLALEPDADDRNPQVRFGFGAGVDRRHHAIFESRFGFPLLEAWAMTETGAGAVIIANQEPRRVGDAVFGKPASDIQCRIVSESEMDVAEGEPGELLVRAAGADPRAGFFDRYLHDPAATAQAWADGWFHTGDVVRCEPDGNFVFVDRRKNIIRRSGENIAAVEVETVLRRDQRVRDVAVAAVPDELRGEEVLAFIVPRAGQGGEAEADAIVRDALGELSYFKVPGWVAFVDQLPLTATQKVQRGVLKTMAGDFVAQGRCIDTRRLKSRIGQRV